MHCTHLLCGKQLTETHNYAQYVRMAAIDHEGLTKAMDLALVTPEEVGRGHRDVPAPTCATSPLAVGR